jgi:CheY-like chemotaxis protein/two-component sensor histidine kinase
MVRLIDDLLDVSRLSRGLLELKREHVDLGATLRTTIESVRPWFERRSHELSVDIADDVVAFVDPTRAAQIFTNLLHNAAKFTPQRGAIRIELGKTAGEALFRVSDSGAGIRADQLERVFEMFARIERPGVTAEPGLGIGLALARRLADLHGGSLRVSSEGEGRGATFELRVPLAVERAVPLSSHPPGANGVSLTSLSMVVVEDNEDIAEVLRDWLETLGHRVTVAGTGGEGIAAIRAVRPDLVVCDLGLPDVHGLEVCRQVRALEVERQPVMIALTGWGREDDIRASKEAGFDHHLVKPVAPERLQALLDQVSESRSAAPVATPLDVAATPLRVERGA